MEVSYGSGIDPERIQKYAVYTYEGVMEDGAAFTRSFIVVKNDYQMIVRFTHLQDYAGVYRRGSFVPITSDPRPRLHYICRMLNFILVEHGAAYQARHVFDITKPMMETFFADYALANERRISVTVERNRVRRYCQFSSSYLIPFVNRVLRSSDEIPLV